MFDVPGSTLNVQAKTFAQIKEEYNGLRREFGLPIVTDWTTKPKFKCSTLMRRVAGLERRDEAFAMKSQSVVGGLLSGFLRSISPEVMHRTNFEVYARDIVLERFKYDISNIGGLEKVRMTDRILSDMRRLKMSDERSYAELLIVELRRSGRIS
ncbi:MAG: hypothetical protein WCS09_17725 [Pseudomonadota bacterium]